MSIFALTSKDSFALHVLRSTLIVSLSLVLLPVSLAITVTALLLRTLRIVRVPRRALPQDASRPPRILITGVGMAKGLFLARTIYLGGCDVYGGNFSRHGNLYSGRFSVAFRKFFALKSPATDGVEAYIEQVVGIIESEKMDMWISCSKIATAAEDAQLAQVIERSTQCKVFQFDEEVVEMLHNKTRFMRKTSELGLANISWHWLENAASIPGVLKKMSQGPQDVQFMLKCANMDDIETRGTLPLLHPQRLPHAEKVLRALDYTHNRQWILQEYLPSGEEYCTHAVIIHGRVRAFTASPSAPVLLHYRPLPPHSPLYTQMLQFTQSYAHALGPVTGHLSFDFLLRYRPTTSPTTSGYTCTLAPIECNPRAHTATVLFAGAEPALAAAYLALLSPATSTHTTPDPHILHAATPSHAGFYWAAHDIPLACAAVLDLLAGYADYATAMGRVVACVEHVLMWRDPMFEWWDPLPWVVLNHVYWPVEMALAVVEGVKWSEVNVSTMKMFTA